MRATERGMTLVGVMMLIVALAGLGLLGLRSAARDQQRSGRLVAHERAQPAARAAVELALARLRPLDDAAREEVRL